MDILISGNEKIIAMLHSLQNKKVDGDTFKPSHFNYYQAAKNDWLVYNTLYNTLARLKNSEYEKLRGEKVAGKVLTKKFLAEGLIVEKNLDEFKTFERWAKMQRKIDKPYLSLNITTTLKCNARCFYCYEKGVKRCDLPAAQTQSIIQFIKSKLREGDMLALTWFGGEPLLNPAPLDNVADALTGAGIDFSSYIITNGSLITKKLVAEKFSRWKVKDVQITLDGMAETYEKRKNYLKVRRGIFNRILKKIATVAAAGITVHLRLNVERANMQEIFELVPLLEEKFGNLPEVTWYPAFLTEVGEDLTQDEKISFVKNLFATLKNPTKMNAARRIHSTPKSFACMRNDPHSITVDVFGNIYTCEHLVGKKSESIGTLENFDEKINRQRIKEALRKECKKCIFLPKCMGGCAVNLETDDEPCFIEKYIIQGYLAYMAEK